MPTLAGFGEMWDILVCFCVHFCFCLRYRPWISCPEQCVCSKYSGCSDSMNFSALFWSFSSFSFLFYCWWWLCGGWFQSVCRPVICLLFWGGRNYNKITGSKKFETYISNYYYFLHTRLILSSYFLGLLNVQDVLFFFLTIPSV